MPGAPVPPNQSYVEDAADDEENYRGLNRSVHLLREEVSGLREMLEGAMRALSGAQRAYGAVSQHVDILSKRVEVAEARNRRLQTDVERLLKERLETTVMPTPST